MYICVCVLEDVFNTEFKKCCPPKDDEMAEAMPEEILTSLLLNEKVNKYSIAAFFLSSYNYIKEVVKMLCEKSLHDLFNNQVQVDDYFFLSNTSSDYSFVPWLLFD